MLRHERQSLKGAAERTKEQDTLLASLERRVAKLEAGFDHLVMEETPMFTPGGMRIPRATTAGSEPGVKKNTKKAKKAEGGEG